MAAYTVDASRQHDTIIIGAGMAGLSCAARLYQNDNYRMKNRLLVLEGRNRIGGRIGAVEVHGSRLDTGANWIHGIGTKEKPNPLMSILPDKRRRVLSNVVATKAPETRDGESNVDVEESEDDWVRTPLIVGRKSDDLSGKDAIVPAEIGGVLMGSIWELIGSLHEKAHQLPASQAKQTTVLSAVIEDEGLREAYEQLPREYHHTLSAIPQWLENMEAAPLAAQSVENPESAPGMSLLEFGTNDFDGDQVFLQDGYLKLIEEVAKDLLGHDLVKTCVTVKQIRWAESPVVIETTDGLYSAKQVVCTIPLGVLQHSLKTNPSDAKPLFEPALPSKKHDAIQSLGFGTLDKIFLVYKDAWWESEPFASIVEKGNVRRSFVDDTEEDRVKSIQTSDDSTSVSGSFDMLFAFTDELPGLEIHRDGHVSSGATILTCINHTNLTGFPVLSAFVSCSHAVRIEAMSDEEAAGILRRALTRSFGQEIPKPEGVHVTRWSQDEFSKGSYSHMITGLTELAHRGEFQKPLLNSQGAGLRFAGEHTSKNHFATVHGALLSGWREADEILKIVDQGTS